MIHRKREKELNKWIDGGKDALLLDGVRQAGKTYLIRECLKAKGSDYIEFNFLDHDAYLPLFNAAASSSSESFISALRVIAKRKINPDTILFFDEVQKCKELVTIIKFLVEGGKARYLLSGSLLGVELTGIRSAPVGYMSTLDLYPLDLEEFFLASGLGEDVMDGLRECLFEEKEVPPLIHEALLKAFYRYLIVGGMPEAVQNYLDKDDLFEVGEVHRKIMREYYRDFSDYENKYSLKLRSTYDLIPSELNMKNKRYCFADLDRNMKFDRYQESFEWLRQAGVAIPCYNVTEFTAPLMASRKSNLFKLFLSDAGLLSSAYGEATIMGLLDNGKDLNAGAIFENFVAQELNSHRYPIYYANSKRLGEIDFLIERDGKPLPIEVKSGPDYHSHPSLNHFLDEGIFEEGIVFSKGNVERKGKVLYLPIYMAMFLENAPASGSAGKQDLSLLRF